MKPSELLSRTFVTLGILLSVAVPLFLWARTPLIHAKMADGGGWNPEVIKAEAGKPLHLKLTSDDVVHGFAVGQMDMQAVDIQPGKVSEVTLRFDKPGTYTFFCTRWCGVNHWRMRGTIEVSGPGAETDFANTVPLYVTLNLDIDAPHESPAIPGARPSAARGENLAAQVDLSTLSGPDFYRANSPYQAFAALGATSLSDSEKWNLVAYIWQMNATSESLENGRDIYARNCAACHGEKGGGDGVFAGELARAGEASRQSMHGSTEMSMQGPVDFTDPKRMLGAAPALLQGKILRGGMGTGMPMWGSIFTEGQIWDLIAYLYSFQFEYEQTPN